MKKQRTQKILSLLLIFSLIFSAFAITANASAYGKLYFVNSVSSAYSVPEGYIGIYNVNDLTQIGESETYPSDGKYILMRDIAMQGRRFTDAIVKEFSGEFDGNGYEISGFVIQPEYELQEETVNIGVFGKVYGNATIKNLGVGFNAVIGNSLQTKNIIKIGGVAAEVYGVNSSNYGDDCTVTIENCYAVSLIQMYCSPKTLQVGGMVGSAENGVVIKDCYSIPQINVSAQIEERNHFDFCVGGVAGFTDYWWRPVTIENCVVMGTVAASSVSNDEESCEILIGGIVGAAEGTNIKRCANITPPISEGSYGVFVRNAYSACAGGIAGFTQSEMYIEECYNWATVRAEVKNSFVKAGGIAGKCHASSYGDAFTKITNCFNAGKIVASVTETKDYGSTFVEAGGIAGHMSTDENVIAIENCYNSSEVIEAYVNSNGTKTTNTDYTANGAITGSDKFIENELKNVYSCDVEANTTNNTIRVLSKSEMIKEESYSGFDFDGVWDINRWADYPYPTLRSLSKYSKYLPKAVRVEEIVMADTLLLNYKESAKISYEINPKEAEIVKTQWVSSDESVVKVSEDGVVEACGEGKATIYCMVTDVYGVRCADECEVTVTYAWWQWIIRILLLGFLWY